MAQWTVIDPNTLLPGDPWTSAKAQAAFENVEALAEGAPGAPIIQSGWGPWNGGVYGSGDALIYDHAVDGNVTSIETPDLSPDYEYKLVWKNLSRTAASNADLLLDLFLTDTDAYTISGADLGRLGDSFGTYDNTGSIKVPRLTGNDTQVIIKVISAEDLIGTNSNTLVGPSQETLPDAFRVIKRTSPTRVGKVRLRASATDGIRQGKVYLFRRLVEGL